MEKTKASRSKSNAKTAKRSVAAIEQYYKEYVLTEGSTPASVFIFCKKMGLKEGEFYECFGSLEGLEKSIWKGYIDKVLQRQTSDSNYAAFGVREKVLSFYFSLTEVLKSERSFALTQLKKWKNPVIQPSFIKGFHASFEA
ncbi:MAG TPA: hypothetical protein VKQ08_12610, partial [Cyclobacteriaceae bacterium]|nr:hypothetical protein [Cyclobacteriaceae bacterium]